MSKMIGIGIPINQSNKPRPIFVLLHPSCRNRSVPLERSIALRGSTGPGVHDINHLPISDYRLGRAHQQSAAWR
jgi:hypothetical protein